jgi:hypothetical protein
MRYNIIKIRNGLWRLEWENGSHSEHSTRDGAERMAFQIESQKPPQKDNYK